MAADDEPWGFMFDEVFTRPDGSRRSREEALRLVGRRGVWLAELRQALLEAQSRPPPLSAPPRVFLSYRWQDEESNAWVGDLAAKLEARGYAVVYDRAAEREPEPPTVPELVARLADCHVFLALIDPGYLERVGLPGAATIKDGWVFDEHQVALGLSNAERLKLIGLVRQGGASGLPGGFQTPARGRPGNTLDARTPEALSRALDLAFPEVPAPPEPALAERAAATLEAARQARREGDPRRAVALARQAAETVPQALECFLELARLAIDAGDLATASEAAARARELAPHDLRCSVAAAHAAYRLGRHHEAIAASVDAARASPRYFEAQWVLGNALDELGQCYAGLARLRIAAQVGPDLSTLHVDRGVACRHVGRLDEALECFERAQRLAPEDLNVLLNLASTAIEAGDAERARAGIAEIARHHPDHQAAGRLEELLGSWELSGGEPPRLVRRLPARTAIAHLVCKHCEADIPLTGKRHTVCTACGAERLDPAGTCDCCGDDGCLLAIPGLGMICPYCRQASMRLTPAAARPR